MLLLAGGLVARERQAAITQLKQINNQLSEAYQAETKARARAEQERVRAEDAFKQAEQERTRAQEAFERTRLALDFLTDTSDKAMADRPELQADRRLLLAAALDYYLDFIEQVGDDPSLRPQFEASQMQVASIMAKIGTQEQKRSRAGTSPADSREDAPRPAAFADLAKWSGLDLPPPERIAWRAELGYLTEPDGRGASGPVAGSDRADQAAERRAAAFRSV